MLRLVVAEGSEYERWVGQLIPVAGSVSGTATTAGHLVVVGDLRTEPRTPAAAERATGLIGETVAVPHVGAGGVGVNGVLTASRRPGDEPFDQLDLDLITAVAAHAGLAMQLSQVRLDNEQLRLIEDRQQINEVDAIIRDIRTAVFALNPTPPAQTQAEQVTDLDAST